MGLERLKEYLDNKNYKEALIFLQGLLNDGKISKNDIYLETAKIYYHLSEYDNALKYLFMLKDGGYSEQYMVYFEIGKIYNEVSDYKKAVVNLQKSLDLTDNGNTMKVYIAVLLAKTYKILHKYSSAIEVLDKIRDKFTLDIINETYCEINEELYQRFPGNYGFDGDYNQLITNYLKELAENPFNSQVLCFLAQAYNYTGLYKETVNLYENNFNKIEDNVFFKNKFLNEYEIASKKTVLESKPRNLMAVLSNKCNIACIMCLTSRSKWELPKERLDEIMSLFPYLERVMWQGGEVLFLPYFKDILKHALNYPNMRQSLITNFQLADEEIIELIVKNNIEMTISIDGIKKETYEKIRRGAKFDVLEKNLRLLNEIRNKFKNKIILNMNVVVMRENYSDLDKFVDFAAKYKFDFICYMPIDYLPKNPTEKEVAIKKEQDIFTNISDADIKLLSFQMMSVHKKAEEYGIRVESRLKTVSLTDEEISAFDADKIFENKKEEKLPENGLSNDIEENDISEECGNKEFHKEYNQEKTAPVENKLLCHLPWYSLTLDFDGSVRPDCQCYIHENIGHLKGSSIESLWNNEKMKFYRESIIKNNYGDLCNDNCISGRITEFHLKLL
ncbi:MAG: radical SAM protein [Endomicrobiaceae bacterium]